MKSILSQYPRIVYLLLLFFFLQQLSFYLFNYLLSGYFNLQDSEAFGNAIGAWAPFLGGFAVVAGGWIADQVKDVKYGMMTSIAMLVLGGIISLLSFPGAGLVGETIIQGANATFMVLVFLHLAIFFPVANDWKDNAFMLLFLAAYFAAFIGILLLSAFDSILPGNVAAVVPLTVSVLLIGLIYRNKHVGFQIEEEEEEVPASGSSKRNILVGMTLFASICLGAAIFFPGIGTGETMMMDSVVGILGGRFLSMVVMLGGIWLLLWSTTSGSRQFDKVCWGIAIMLGVVLLEFVVRLSGNYELDSFSDMFSRIVHDILWLPALIAALTHVNFDKQAGLWLGIFLGVPKLILALAGMLAGLFESSLLLPVIFILLLIVALIWLRENRSYLQNLLRLDEPNFEVETKEEEDDDGDDIIDHLIDKHA